MPHLCPSGRQSARKQGQTLGGSGVTRQSEYRKPSRLPDTNPANFLEDAISFTGDIVFKDPCADLLPCFVAVEINVRGDAGLSLRDRYAYTMLYHALRA